MTANKSNSSWPAIGYTSIAIICFNSLILFLMINLVVGAALDVKQHFRKKAATTGTPWAYKSFNPALSAVHPDLTPEEITSLIAETRHLTQTYDPYTQFKEKPSHGQYVSVDPRGFRLVAHQQSWPPPKGEFTVFFFGGSTTFGYGVEDSLTVPSLFQEVLARDYGIAAGVYNFGRGSYFSVQERYLFEKLLIEGFVPDVAVFIDGLNDFTNVYGEPARTKDLQDFMDGGEISLPRRVLRALPVTRALGLMQAPRRDDPGKSRDSFKKFPPAHQKEILRRVVERYLTNKRMTEALAREFNVVPVFVWQPVPVYKHDRQHCVFGGYDYDNGLPALRPGYQLMAETAEKQPLGRNFIWAADIQENLEKPLYVDAVHYGGELSRILAKSIAEKVRKRNLHEAFTAPGVSSTLRANSEPARKHEVGLTSLRYGGAR